MDEDDQQDMEKPKAIVCKFILHTC